MSDVFGATDVNPFEKYVVPQAPPAEEPSNPFAKYVAPIPTPPPVQAAPVAPTAPQEPFKGRTALGLGNITTLGQPATRVPIPGEVNPFAKYAAPAAPLAPGAGGPAEDPFATTGPPIRPQTPPAEPANLVEEFTSGVSRQMASPGVGSGFNLLGLQLGTMDPLTWAKEQAAMQRQMALAPQSGAAASRLDPHWWAARAGELLPQVGEIGLWTAAGIPASAIGGPLATASAAGALMDMSSSFLDRLKTKYGVDTSNEAELYLAITNPQVFEDTFWYSARRAGAVGLLSAATGGIAGKILPSVLPGRIIGAATSPVGEAIALHAPRTVLQKTGQAAVGAGIGAVGGGIQEAGAQVAATGHIDNFWDVVDEALIGPIASVPEVVAPAVGAAGRKAIGPRAAIRPTDWGTWRIEVADPNPDAAPSIVTMRGTRAAADATVAEHVANGRAARVLPSEPPIAYTVGPDGQPHLTDTRVDPDTLHPDVQTATELINRIHDAGEDPHYPGVTNPRNRTPAQWLAALGADPTRSIIERNVSDFLHRERRVDADSPVSMARVLQEASHGLLATNWEYWRATGRTALQATGPSLMSPLVIAQPFSTTNLGLMATSRFDAPGRTEASFKITSEGNSIGDLSVTVESPGTRIHVNWIGADLSLGTHDALIQKLGIRGVRTVLSLLKQEFPNANRISGWRVSGARAHSGSGAADAMMRFEGDPATLQPTRRLVSFSLPDDLRVVNLAEGRADGKRTLIVSTVQDMSPAHIQKVIDHARAEGYDAIAFAGDSKLGAGIADALGVDAEATPVDILFGDREVLGVVPLERELPTHATLANASVDVQTAELRGEPYATGRFTADQVTDVMSRVNRIVQFLAKSFHLSGKVKIVVLDEGDIDALDAGRFAKVYYEFGGDSTIAIMPSRAPTLARLFTRTMHEFGHIVLFDKFYRTDVRTQIAILHEYALWHERTEAADTAGEQRRHIMLDRLSPAELSDLYGRRFRINGMPSSMATSDEYWSSFEEWFAANFTKWSTTQLRPLTVVDRFFNSLAKELKRLLERAYRAAGLQFDPPPAMKAYLDAFLEEVNPGAFKNIYDRIEMETRLANGEALSAMGAEYVEPVGQTAATGPSREIALRLFGPKNNQIVDPVTGAVTYRVEANKTYRRGGKKTVLEIMRGQAAITDKIFTLYTGGLGIYQLAQRNLHIPGLQRFNEFLQEADAFAKSIMNRAIKTTKLAEKLSTNQTLRLHDALDDYVQMRYRTPQEVNRKVKRMPTEAELTAIWDKHELTEQARQVFARQVTDYSYALDLVEQQAREEIGRSFQSLDPAARLIRQAMALEELDQEMAIMRKAPYIPQMRWGMHTTTVYDHEKNILWFSQDETVRQQAATYASLREIYPDEVANPIIRSVLAEDVVPLMGLPRPLLNRLKEKAGFSKTQLAYIEDLAYELSPVHSFKHRMQTKQNVAGYAKDFSRAYANYFLHFANYMAKAKWGDRMREAVDEVQEQGRYMPDDTKSWQDWFGLYSPRGSKRGRIGNEMADHLRDWMDPKADFWVAKGVSFFIALGYAPLAALVNLSGILTGGYAILAEGFGDKAALKHLGKAGARFMRHRTKIDSPLGDDQMLMRQVLTDEGVINESFAANLAAIAEGRNMLEQVSNKKIARGFYWFLEKSSLLFQFTEMTVRINVADAAYTAAIEQPGAKFVNDSIQSEKLLFDRLVLENGVNPTHAAAIVTAKRAVHNSQGIYAQWARPRLFRGKRGTLFQFKAFQQNLLWSMWNHKQGAIRSLLAFGLLGGMMGLPGAEDISDILKWLARMLFGKDFDLERDARDMMVTWAKTDPGLFLHGVSSKGFGIPAALDLMGRVAGYRGVPFPESDLSSRFGAGSISPVPLSIFLTPTDNPDEAMGRAAERAGGAALGLAFNAYRAVTDTKNSDHWLRLLPSAIRNMPKAWEAFQTGELRGPSGAAIIKFDTRDTEQMSEIIAYALGANPSRLTAEWAADRETHEIIDFWDTRQQVLMRQMMEAIRSNDLEERASVMEAIRYYNETLPASVRSKKITSTMIRQSMESRVRQEIMNERNIPSRPQDRPISSHIHDIYFPDSVEATKVK